MIVDCSLWPGRALAYCLWMLVCVGHVCATAHYISFALAPGALSVDESLSLVQAVCGGNSSTLGFVLMPLPHSSAAHTAILNHRRAIENTCIATLECNDMCQPYVCVHVAAWLASMSMSMCTCALCTSGHLMCKRSAWSTRRALTVETKGRQTNTVPQPRQFAKSWSLFQYLFRTVNMNLVCYFVRSGADIGGSKACWVEQKSHDAWFAHWDRQGQSYGLAEPWWWPSVSTTLSGYLFKKNVRLCNCKLNIASKIQVCLHNTYFSVLSFKVQQRGVEASKSILMKMLDGLQLPEGSPILVVDCLPNKLFGQLVGVIVSLESLMMMIIWWWW